MADKKLETILTLDKEGFHKALKSAGDDVEGFTRTSASGSTASKGHFGAVAGAAAGAGIAIGAAAVAGGAALVKITSDAAGYAREIGLAATATGMSVEQVEKMKFAAEKSGTTLDKVETSTIRLAKAMNAAKEGTGPQAEMFAKLGINVTNADGSLRNVNDVLLNVADGMKNTTNPTERMVLATTLMGRGAGEMIPMLAKGSDGIRALGDEATKFGIVLDEKGIANLRAFRAESGRVKDALSGLKLSIASEAAPAMTGMAKSLQDVIIQLQQSDALKNFFAAIGKTIQDVIPPLMHFVGQILNLLSTSNVFQTLGSIIGQCFSVLSGLLSAIAPAIGPLMGLLGELAKPILDLVQTIGTALQPAFVAIGKIITDISPFIGDLAKALGDILGTAFQIVMSAITPFLPVLDKLLVALLPPLVTIVEAVAKAFEPLAPVIADLASKLAGPLSDILIAITPILQTLADLLSGALSGAVTGAISVIWLLCKPLEALMSTVDKVMKVLGVFFTDSKSSFQLWKEQNEKNLGDSKGAFESWASSAQGTMSETYKNIAGLPEKVRPAAVEGLHKMQIDMADEILKHSDLAAGNQKKVMDAVTNIVNTTDLKSPTRKKIEELAQQITDSSGLPIEQSRLLIEAVVGKVSGADTKTPGKKVTQDYADGIADPTAGAHANASAKSVVNNAIANMSGGDASTLGANLAQAYADGMSASWVLAIVRAKAAYLAIVAKQAIEEQQKSKSPSQVGLALGANLGQGYAEGILSQAKAAGDAAQMLSLAGIGGFGSMLGLSNAVPALVTGASGGSSVTTSTNTYHVAVNVNGAGDPVAVAEEVRRVIDQITNDGAHLRRVMP